MAGADSPPRSDPVPLSVIVPTRGNETPLAVLLAALERQTLPRQRWELIVAFDGVEPAEPVRRRLEALGGVAVALGERRGPGAARNEAARRATGEFLGFTEDDCTPEPDWLARAAARLEHERAPDVLEGATLLPDGRPVRRRHADLPTWLPTNLFIRRELFQRVGGYCERYFDRESGIYFREDSDLGFTLREAGARAEHDATVRVTHPREHPNWLDPIRWARRYEMDPLLESRHPRAFRDEIEVMHWGPLRVRRPFVRVCGGYVVALLAAAAAAAWGEAALAALLAWIAVASLLVVWSKWRFDPRKLPAVAIVPFILFASLARGARRVRSQGAG